GIATLPDWLVSSLTKQSLVQTKRIGEKGIYKTLYARYQPDSKLTSVIKEFIPQTLTAFEQLYHTQSL
ncbi:MAG: LysR family transcriptional regulator, partial [Colwellia sp.]|nr:LysR family transcriptional regulator [Colwellia sp.]